MLWSNEARQATTTEAHAPEPMLRNKRSHHNEKPTPHKYRAAPTQHS